MIRTSRDKNARWIVVGLAATAAGFLGASLDPGAGPRTVKGSLTLGPFYLPPLLVALVCVGVAALDARGSRRWLVVAGIFAVVLLVGSATMGWAAVSYRITHPAHPLGFVEDWLEVIGEATAAVAAFAAARHRPGRRTRRQTNRFVRLTHTFDRE